MSSQDELIRVAATLGLRVVREPGFDVLEPAVRDVVQVRGGWLDHKECALGELRDHVVGDYAVSACFLVVHNVRGEMREAVSEAKEAKVLKYTSAIVGVAGRPLEVLREALLRE